MFIGVSTDIETLTRDRLRSDEIKEYKERHERASHSQVSKRECQDDSLEPKAPKQVNEPKMVSRVTC